MDEEIRRRLESELAILFNAGFFCQADEVGNRPYAQLLHDASAMYFNSHFCDTELSCNLFVQHTGDDITKNLIFARSEKFNTLYNFLCFLEA